MLPPFPADRLWTDAEKIAPYANDEAWKGSSPRAVAFPVSTQEVSSLLSWANASRVPVVPRGAGSGLSGAAAPPAGALVLSLERMNRLLEVDPRDLTATVEPGLITGELRRAAEAKGLLYAPIPASVDFCSIGGNVATNAGGLCAVKYGVTRAHVLGLEAVLATGEVITTGGRFTKSSTGYDLTQLLCGSEGTLAVITRITVRLLPLPRERMTMLVPFASVAAVAEGVVAVLGTGVIPPTMELLPKAAVDLVLAKHPEYPFPFKDAAASLLVEMDGDEAGAIAEKVAFLAETLARHGGGEAAIASSAKQRDELWTLRKQVRDSIATSGEYIEADSVVPRPALPALLEAAESAARAAGVPQISYGHAGDGNLHTYFRRGSSSDAAWAKAKPAVLESFFRATVALGGTLSGEHGIGAAKREYMPIALSPAQLSLMRRLKSAFDPNGILNPGKVLPG
jgi:glycolate oxidase